MIFVLIHCVSLESKIVFVNIRQMNCMLHQTNTCLVQLIDKINVSVYSNHSLLSQVKLSEYIGKKYVILFFYPLDFTFVCPTGQFKTYSHIHYCQNLKTATLYISCELITYFILFLLFFNFFMTEITAFSDRYEEFQKLNTEVLGVSIDSVVSWFNIIIICVLHLCLHLSYALFFLMASPD